MNAGKTLFSQLMDCLPWSTFARVVAGYHGDHSVQTFPCTEQYRAMAFAQLTYRESLRDIEACLSAQPAKLWHMGFHGAHLRRVRAAADRAGETAICRREPAGGPEQHGLRVGFNHHRFVPVIVPMGAFQIDEGRREDAHVA
jgi:hypothetical protein